MKQNLLFLTGILAISWLIIKAIQFDSKRHNLTFTEYYERACGKYYDISCEQLAQEYREQKKLEKFIHSQGFLIK